MIFAVIPAELQEGIDGFSELDPLQDYQLRHSNGGDDLNNALLRAYGADAAEHYDTWADAENLFLDSAVYVAVTDEHDSGYVNPKRRVLRIVTPASLTEGVQCVPYYRRGIVDLSRGYVSDVLPSSIGSQQIIKTSFHASVRLTDAQESNSTRPELEHGNDCYNLGFEPLILNSHEISLLVDGRRLGRRDQMPNEGDNVEIRVEKTTALNDEYPVGLKLEDRETVSLLIESEEFAVSFHALFRFLKELATSKRPKSRGRSNLAAIDRHDALPETNPTVLELYKKGHTELFSRKKTLWEPVAEDMILAVQSLVRQIVLGQKSRDPVTV